jgi:hypothetical protein
MWIEDLDNSDHLTSWENCEGPPVVPLSDFEASSIVVSSHDKQKAGRTPRPASPDGSNRPHLSERADERQACILEDSFPGLLSPRRGYLFGADSLLNRQE